MDSHQRQGTLGQFDAQMFTRAVWSYRHARTHTQSGGGGEFFCGKMLCRLAHWQLFTFHFEYVQAYLSAPGWNTRTPMWAQLRQLCYLFIRTCVLISMQAQPLHYSQFIYQFFQILMLGTINDAANPLLQLTDVHFGYTTHVLFFWCSVCTFCQPLGRV